MVGSKSHCRAVPAVPSPILCASHLIFIISSKLAYEVKNCNDLMFLWAMYRYDPRGDYNSSSILIFIKTAFLWYFIDLCHQTLDSEKSIAQNAVYSVKLLHFVSKTSNL